jgi:chorismate mutase
MAQERDVREQDEIDKWRHRIDLIDGQLMSLLNSRSACAVEIGRIKRRLGLPVYSPEREAWILERVMRDNPGPLDPTAVRLERLAADGPEDPDGPPGPRGDGTEGD